MPNYKITYQYTEEGIGYTFIEADSEEEAKEIFENHNKWTPHETIMENSSEEISKIKEWI